MTLICAVYLSLETRKGDRIQYICSFLRHKRTRSILSCLKATPTHWLLDKLIATLILWLIINYQYPYLKSKIL